MPSEKRREFMRSRSQFLSFLTLTHTKQHRGITSSSKIKILPIFWQFLKTLAQLPALMQSAKALNHSITDDPEKNADPASSKRALILKPDSASTYVSFPTPGKLVATDQLNDRNNEVSQQNMFTAEADGTTEASNSDDYTQAIDLQILPDDTVLTNEVRQQILNLQQNRLAVTTLSPLVIAKAFPIQFENQHQLHMFTIEADGKIEALNSDDCTQAIDLQILSDHAVLMRVVDNDLFVNMNLLMMDPAIAGDRSHEMDTKVNHIATLIKTIKDCAQEKNLQSHFTLQETFETTGATELIKKLQKMELAVSVAHKSNSLLTEGPGLITASTSDIPAARSRQFTIASGTDRFAEKGVLLSLTENIPERKNVAIISCHPQANTYFKKFFDKTGNLNQAQFEQDKRRTGVIRALQMLTVLDAIREAKSPEYDCNIMVCGDMNTDPSGPGTAALECLLDTDCQRKTTLEATWLPDMAFKQPQDDFPAESKIACDEPTLDSKAKNEHKDKSPHTILDQILLLAPDYIVPTLECNDVSYKQLVFDTLTWVQTRIKQTDRKQCRPPHSIAHSYEEDDNNTQFITVEALFEITAHFLMALGLARRCEIQLPDNLPIDPLQRMYSIITRLQTPIKDHTFDANTEDETTAQLVSNFDFSTTINDQSDRYVRSNQRQRHVITLCQVFAVITPVCSTLLGLGYGFCQLTMHMPALAEILTHSISFGASNAQALLQPLGYASLIVGVLALCIIVTSIALKSANRKQTTPLAQASLTQSEEAPRQPVRGGESKNPDL